MQHLINAGLAGTAVPAIRSLRHKVLPFPNAQACIASISLMWTEMMQITSDRLRELRNTKNRTHQAQKNLLAVIAKVEGHTYG